MTDERLLEQAASGDETAFAVIYERHRGLVFRFAYRLSQSREMAEEITHDCFLSLIKKPQRFKTQEQRASLRTYLQGGNWHLWVLLETEYQPSPDLAKAYKLLSKGNCCVFAAADLDYYKKPPPSKK
jgi:hypothetical protein